MKKVLFYTIAILSIFTFFSCATNKVEENLVPLENELNPYFESSEEQKPVDEVPEVSQTTDETEILSEEENSSEVTEDNENLTDEDSVDLENVEEIPSENEENLEEIPNEETENVEVEEIVEEEIPVEEINDISEAENVSLDDDGVAIITTEETFISSADTKSLTQKKTSVEETQVVEEVKKEVVKPSRSVVVKINEYLDVLYPGSGWIYLGEVEQLNLVRYNGRKIGEVDTSFTLRAVAEGTTVLHFYKKDNLTNSSIDDYLEVIIAGESDTFEHKNAPSYQNYKRSSTVTTPTVTKEQSTTKTNISTQETTKSSGETETAVLENTENLSSDELLEKAKNSFENYDYKKSLEYLELFMMNAATKVDEALFLKGQILESNSKFRDIKASLECYEQIVTNYPKSIYWKKASDRITYIKRLYIDIM